MITKKTNRSDDYDFEKGEVILIDKAVDKSSFYAVSKIRKAGNVKKVGHAGTLDPFATGLLIICTGKKTKEITNYQDLPKTYTGIMLLGKKTPSMDTETEVIEEKSIEGITPQKISEIKEKFTGDIIQFPPMYSAVKHKGKALYKFARKGIEIERKPREAKIYNFEITKFNLPEIHFEITCSKGTYIRVIANDIGEELGCGAHLIKLRRTQIGEHKVEDALTVEEFEKIFDYNYFKQKPENIPLN